MSRRWWMAAAVSPVLVVLVACSGSTTGDVSVVSTLPSAEHPSKADYIAAANARCAELNSDSIALSKSYESGPDTPAATAAFLRQNADLIEITIDELRARPRPSGDEATLDEVYEKAAALPPVARDMATAVDQGDMQTYDVLDEKGDQVQDEANDASDAYGLTVCGSGSDDTTA